MKYRIIYSKPNSEEPLQTYKDSREDALKLAEQLRASGYDVDVWKQTEDGSQVVVDTKWELMPKAWLEKKTMQENAILR